MSKIKKHIIKSGYIYVLLVILSVLLLTLFASISLNHLKTSVNNEGAKLAKTTKSNLFVLLNDEINQPVIIAKNMANTTFLHDWIVEYDKGNANEDDVVRYLKNIVDTTIAENAFFVSADNLNDYTNLGFNKTLSRQDKHDVWYYNFLDEGKPYLLNIGTEETRNMELMLFVNTRIEDENGKLLGVCGVGVSFNYIENLIQKFCDSEKVSVYLVDSKGNMQFGVADPDSPTLDIKELLQTSKGKLDHIERNDSHGFTLIQYIPSFNWYMTVTSINATMDAAYYKLVKELLLVFVLVWIICIISIIAFYRQWEKKKVAEFANKSKTDFLSRMSHDIRTPMNGITGMVHIAETNIEDSNKVSDALRKIEHSTHQLESLINDVLEMTRLESGHIELNREAFNIPETLSELAPSIEVLASNKSVIRAGSHYNINHEWVIGSSLQLLRIIQNILSNGIKYNRPGGSIEVWCNEHPIDENHSNYEFIIKDTGIGMSKEFQEHMFEPFSREHKTSGTTYTGTGLGLAITKEIVDLMNGTIVVDSQLNVGTTITITIPFELTSPVETTTIEEGSKSLAEMHILLVEDNVINQEIATYILEENGATVTTAENGAEAVKIFEEKPPCTFDLILMDIMMPIMNGYEATKAIRSSKRKDAKKIKIIAMTANAFVEDVKASLDAGMNDHISKPIEIHVLLEKINKVFK